MEPAAHALTSYRPAPGLPDVPFFTCDRLRASLTVPACAKRWRVAAKRHAERFAACRGCPIGACHAGERKASLSPLRGSLLCSRCHGGQLRLIAGNLCVSCYNREREVIRGKNARGMRPTLLAPLDPRSVCYASNGRVTIARRSRTASAAELVIATLRDAPHEVAFGFRGPSVGMRQLRLW